MMTSAPGRFLIGAVAIFLTSQLTQPAFAVADDVAGTRVPRAKLAPFFTRYCVDCHGPDEQNGQLRFDSLAWEITNNDSAQRWQDILDVLNGGDMPPEDADQPDNDELSHTLDTLTGTLRVARRRLTDHGGEITMRRLNRREYANTIRQLFGFRITHDLIPEDGEAETFDTVGAEQLFTSAHFDRYLELGEQIGEWGFAWSGKPHQKSGIKTQSPHKTTTAVLRRKLADLDNKMAMKKAGKTWKEMGFKDAGQAEVVFSQFQRRAGNRRRYMQYPHIDRGVYLAAVDNNTRRIGMNRGIDPRATYVYRVRGGVVGDPPELRRFLEISDKGGPVGVLRMTGSPEKPGTVEMRVVGKLPYRVMGFGLEESRADLRVLEQYIRRLDPDGEWASLWIERMEIEGPFYDSEKPANTFASILYPDGYVRGLSPRLRNDSVTREFLREFTYEAFRHQRPSQRYLNKLFELYQSYRSEKQSHVQAMSRVVGVILSSPQFLFLREPSGQPGKRRQLTDLELAIRLSYFLWSGPPDKTLYGLADKRQLSRPAILNQQVERMLADVKAESFFAGFMSQWAELERFDAITVDESEHFRFNRGIRMSARRETVEFFKTLVRENLPIGNLIDSDFVTVNAQLAEHYGIAGVRSNEFRKVKLPANSERGGLMTQAAFLTAGSNGERSSPVIRGALVMDKLLHDKPAPPPPNVPELGAASKKPLTNREMVKLHQGRPVCASCHRKMDVIGFGLENFDPTGRWRDYEKVGRKRVRIDPSGTLPNGSKFKDVRELKRTLLTHKDDVAREVLVSLLEYAAGRSVEFSDTDRVEAVLSQLKADDYRMQSMIKAAVASKLFGTK